jgi:hypothetical protein
MAGFIQNILWNSVEGFVEAGTRTAGEYAGNALIKAGDMIENGGRGVGNSTNSKTVLLFHNMLTFGRQVLRRKQHHTALPSPASLINLHRKRYLPQLVNLLSNDQTQHPRLTSPQLECQNHLVRNRLVRINIQAETKSMARRRLR